MGKCNLLKPLSSNNGNFFMFSQYSEDLTNEYTQKDTARVVPSKFIALNLDTNGLNDDTISNIFQNYYENHCCYWRSQEGYEKSYSWELLLQTLEKFNMISVESDSKLDSNTSSNIKYIGDINIYSNQEIDGMSYNEIYCYIPTDAKEQRWELIRQQQELILSEELLYDVITGELSFIQGFDKSDLQESSTINYYNGLPLTVCMPRDPNTNTWINKFQLHGNNYVLDFNNHIDINLEDSKVSQQFEINTIIVLYDIKNGDEIVHSNLPMGIYFTGMINNGVINNPITKYVSNSEIYDQGTSYGLRICTRYLSLVNIETLQENIKIDTTSDGIYPENVTVLLSKMNESQLLMKNALNKTVENAENLKNHYNLFKTSKTNVPYIQNINGEPYWFVNGKNTDVKVLDISKLNVDIKSITNNELTNITINQCLKNGNIIQETNELKYLDFNQLNNFARGINLEFLSKNLGVTKQEWNQNLQDTKKYIDDNFVKLDNLEKTYSTKLYVINNYAPKISYNYNLLKINNYNTIEKLIDVVTHFNVEYKYKLPNEYNILFPNGPYTYISRSNQKIDVLIDFEFNTESVIQKEVYEKGLYYNTLYMSILPSIFKSICYYNICDVKKGSHIMGVNEFNKMVFELNGGGVQINFNLGELFYNNRFNDGIISIEKIGSLENYYIKIKVTYY